MKIINLQKSTKFDVIKKSIDILKNGGILIYPTETAYGVGVDATNQKAVDRVLEYKARMSGKPLSVAVCHEKMAGQYVLVNNTAKSIYENFLPGPITVISLGLHRVAKGVESEQGALGIRIPDYKLVLEIIQKFGRPITATSANLSGQKTPYSIVDILNNISDKRRQMVDLIIDAGQLPKRPTSTVVDTTMADYRVLRQGAVELSQKEERRKKKEESLRFISKSTQETQQIAAGMMSVYKKNLHDYCLIFLLEGDLGSGKTQFAKGLAAALNIQELVTSPTFNLVRQYPYSSQFPSSITYPFSPSFFHIDTWRLLNPQELEGLGLGPMMQPGNVIAIEWADKVDISKFKIQKSEIIEVKFEHISENQRRIQISALSSLSSISS